MKRQSSRQFCVLPLIFSSSMTLAIDEFDDFSSDLPIITSASRLSQSVLTSPSAVTVIDSAMIEASGFTEVVDLLRLVPGFIVAHVDGTTAAVVSHGEGWEYPNRMQILIDGRSTYSSVLSGIEWLALGVEIEDIDHIEVVRGPAASAYGSNSYSGAINIITKVPELDDRFSLQARYGNHGEKRWLLRTSDVLDNFSYRLSASTRQNDGFDYYKYGDISDIPGYPSEEVPDSQDMQNLNMSGRLTIDPRNELWGNFSFTKGEVDHQRLIIEEEFYDTFNDSDRSIDAWSINLSWDHKFSESRQLKVNFFHNYLDENDMALSAPLSEIFGVSPETIPFLIGEEDQQFEAGLRSYHTERSDLELQYSQLFANGWQYVVGTGIDYDTLKSEAVMPESGTHSNTGYRFFGNVQIPIASFLTANFGGLYEDNRTDESHFSPRASLNFHLTTQQTVRFGYSSAYRIPSLVEENLELDWKTAGGLAIEQVYRNDDMRAEKVTSLDVSYLGQLQNLPISWEFRGYREEYEDSLVFYADAADNDLVDNAYTRIGNGADSTYYGYEGEITFRPEQHSFIRLNFNIGHVSGDKLTDVNRPAPLSSTQIIDISNRAPDSSMGLLMAKQLGSWQFNLGFYHVENLKWSGQGSAVRRYDRWDASVIKRVALSANNELVFRLAGQNIGKEEIFEFNDNNKPREGIEFKPVYYGTITLTYF